jgi:hypothetical protein
VVELGAIRCAQALGFPFGGLKSLNLASGKASSGDCNLEILNCTIVELVTLILHIRITSSPNLACWQAS